MVANEGAEPRYNNASAAMGRMGLPEEVAE